MDVGDVYNRDQRAVFAPEIRTVWVVDDRIKVLLTTWRDNRLLFGRTRRIEVRRWQGEFSANGIPCIIRSAPPAGLRVARRLRSLCALY